MRDALATGRNNFGLGPRDVEALVANFDSRGFGYADYQQGSGQGLSLSSPAHVCAQLEEFPSLRLCLYMESAWGRVRALDAAACTPRRVFEPLSMPMD